MGRTACREGTETEIELGFEKKFDKEKNLVSESKSFWKEIESDVQIKFDLEFDSVNNVITNLLEINGLNLSLQLL